MQFTGRLTADAEIRDVKNDKKVTAFTVAVNKRYKNKAGEKQEKTSFIRGAYWINPGLAIYLTKGVPSWKSTPSLKPKYGRTKAARQRRTSPAAWIKSSCTARLPKLTLQRSPKQKSRCLF
jgi:hypothetical protein